MEALCGIWQLFGSHMHSRRPNSYSIRTWREQLRGCLLQRLGGDGDGGGSVGAHQGGPGFVLTSETKGQQAGADETVFTGIHGLNALVQLLFATPVQSWLTLVTCS